MCLYTNRLKPLVADKDLVVYKELQFTKEGNLVTPCMGIEVKVNSTIKAKKQNFNSDEIFGFHEINDEGVHAYLYNDGQALQFKAIIPKGTKFWVSSDLSEIASSELYITDEIVANINKNNEVDYICDLLLKEVEVKHVNGEIVFQKYHILSRYTGLFLNYFSVEKLCINLLTKEDLVNILSYRLYINACLLKHNYRLLGDDLYWSKNFVVYAPTNTIIAKSSYARYKDTCTHAIISAYTDVSDHP